MGAFLGPSRGAPLWFRPGIVGPRVSGAPTCAAAAAAAWRRAVVLVSRGGGPGWGVRVSWSWYAHQMV